MKRTVLFILAAIFLAAWTPQQAAAQAWPPLGPGNGDGSAANPYVITSVADFQDFATRVNGGESFSGIHVKLGGEIDLQGVTSWTPIGDSNAGHPFKGTFDGGGFSIYDLTISNSGYDQGLFGYIAGNAVITNVVLEGVDVSCNEYAGAIVGYAESGTISKCGVTVSSGGGQCRVSSSNSAGGIVGWMDAGTIENCYTVCEVSVPMSYGHGYVGGIAGGIDPNVTIKACYTTGNITGDNRVGGIVGFIGGGTVENCYATGAIEANSQVGGIAGSVTSNGTVQDCAAINSSVTSNTEASAGGVAGEVDNGSTASNNTIWDDMVVSNGPNAGNGNPSNAGDNPVSTEDINNGALDNIITGDGWVNNPGSLPGLGFGQTGGPTTLPPTLSMADAPGALTVITPPTSGQVLLTWADPASTSTITGYELATGPTPAPDPLVWTAITASGVNSGTVTYTVPSLTNGTEYYFYVRAVNSAGGGTASAEVTATPSAVPDAPANFTATAGDTKVTLTFDAYTLAGPPSNGGSAIASYDLTIAYTGTGGNGTSTQTGIQLTSPAEVTGLTNGNAYTFTLVAKNAAGASSSSSAGPVTPGTAIATPIDFTVTPPAVGVAPVNATTTATTYTVSTAWTDATAATPATFAVNGIYTVAVTLTPVAGNTFPALTASDVPAITGATIQSITNVGGVVTVTYTFSALGATEIATVALVGAGTPAAVIAPAIGGTPAVVADFDAVPNVTITSVDWTDALAAIPTSFAANGEYTVSIVLTPDNGYAFPATIAPADVTIEGAAVTAISQASTYATDGAIVVELTYAQLVPTTISAVDFAFATTPAVGASPTIATEATTAVGYTVTNTTWNVPTTTVFTTGVAYTVAVELTPISAAYEFDAVGPITAPVIAGATPTAALAAGVLTLTYAYNFVALTIDAVALDVDIPVLGDPIASATAALATGESGYSVAGISWNTTDVNFGAATQYTVTVELAPDAGNAFEAIASFTTATINDDDVLASVTASTTTPGNIEVSYTFEEITEITAVAVGIGVPPTAGNLAPSTISNNGLSGYTGAIAWSPALPGDGRFVEGVAYTATITLTANTGFGFAATLATPATATVNALISGNAADVLATPTPTSTSITLQYAFSIRYKLTVEYSAGGAVYSGTTFVGNGNYFNPESGQSIALTATPNSGYRFVNWTSTTTGFTISNPTNANLTVTMPANSVTVKANFEVIPTDPGTPTDPNPPTPDPLADIYAALALIQLDAVNIPQSAASTQATAAAWLTDYLNDYFQRLYYFVHVSDLTFTSFNQATAGTAANINGTNGTVVFSANFSKGSQSVLASSLNGIIIATKFPTANEDATQQALKAVSDNGALLVSGLSAGDELKVYNVSGSLVYSAKVNASEVRIDVTRGVYIVTSGKSVLKVIVR